MLPKSYKESHYIKSANFYLSLLVSYFIPLFCCVSLCVCTLLCHFKETQPSDPSMQVWPHLSVFYYALQYSWRCLTSVQCPYDTGHCSLKMRVGWWNEKLNCPFKITKLPFSMAPYSSLQKVTFLGRKQLDAVSPGKWPEYRPWVSVHIFSKKRKAEVLKMAKN